MQLNAAAAAGSEGAVRTGQGCILQCRWLHRVRSLPSQAEGLQRAVGESAARSLKAAGADLTQTSTDLFFKVRSTETRFFLSSLHNTIT